MRSFLEWMRVREGAGSGWNNRPGNAADFRYHYGGEPGEDNEPHIVTGEYELKRRLHLSGGQFRDGETGRRLPGLDASSLGGVVGSPDDTYTLDSRILVSVELTGSEERPLMSHEQYDIDGFHITNDRTGESVGLPEDAVRDRIVGLAGGPHGAAYAIHFELESPSKLDVTVVPNR